MAASKFISQSLRHYASPSQPSSLFLLRSSQHSHSKSPFLPFHHLFCSSSSSSSEPLESPPPPSPSQPPQPPKPVSYAVKPKPQSPVDQNPNNPQFRTPRDFLSREEDPRAWTREDIRYMKDVPLVSPVSYPSKVANLPEDRVASGTEEGKEEGENLRGNELLERERRRIENDVRLRRVIRGEQEKVLPFPTLVKVEKKKTKALMDLQDAIREVKANAKCKFIETVEAHVGLGVNPKRSDQTVRGTAALPHGTGKVVRVAVFAEGEAAEEARAAGADIVGADELIEEIRKGSVKLNFDKCISTPILMPRVGKIAKILGPRNLMPNPKLGTLTSDVAGAVREAKGGRIDFRIDKTAIVHVGLGKVDFSEESLRENIGAFVTALLRAKPVGLKKTSKYAGYVNSFSLSSTMGPGFPVSIQSVSMAAEEYNRLQLK